MNENDEIFISRIFVVYYLHAILPFPFQLFFCVFFFAQKKKNKIKNTFVNFITLHSTGKKKEKKIHYKIIIKLLIKKYI